MMLEKLDVYMQKRKKKGPLFHTIYNSQLKMD